MYYNRAEKRMACCGQGVAVVDATSAILFGIGKYYDMLVWDSTQCIMNSEQ